MSPLPVVGQQHAMMLTTAECQWPVSLMPDVSSQPYCRVSAASLAKLWHGEVALTRAKVQQFMSADMALPTFAAVAPVAAKPANKTQLKHDTMGVQTRSALACGSLAALYTPLLRLLPTADGRRASARCTGVT